MRRDGFTLIEISIVLLIIALISAGILIGRDLIENAQVRATISQIQSFDAAIGAFRSKYNCYPGDCRNALDYALGEPTCPNPYVWSPQQTITHAGCNGNGDEVLNDDNGNWPMYSPEALGFWYHLLKANLIAVEAVDGKTPSPLTANYTPKFGVSSPYSKIPGIAYMTQGYVGVSYYLLGFRETTLDRLSDEFDLKASMAYNIDAKMDDGKPGAGRVIANGTGCLKYVPPVVEYKLNTTGARCGLNIKMVGYGYR